MKAECEISLVRSVAYSSLFGEIKMYRFQKPAVRSMAHCFGCYITLNFNINLAYENCFKCSLLNTVPQFHGGIREGQCS